MENLKKKIQEVINLYTSRNFSKAEKLGKKLIKLHPEAVFLYNILGLISVEQEKIDEGIKFYENGIKIKPDYAEIFNNLGTANKLKKNYNEAEKNYNQSIKLNNNLAETHNNLGNLFIEMYEFQKAIICFKKSIEINPKLFLAYYNLGIVYKNLGKFEEAKIFLNKTININNYFFSAHRSLSQVTKYTKSNNHLLVLKNLYGNTRIDNKNKSELAFALGKASDDIKDFKNAIKYYIEGNNIHRKNLSFSIEGEKQDFINIKKFFNKNLFKKFEQTKNLDKIPIFILGMPRSGTTLIEQILSSHPDVFGGDELEFLPDLIKKYFNQDNFNHPEIEVNTLKIEKFNEIGKEYLEKLKLISSNSRHVTDKLPVNFKWIGLIKLILPKAKIIHCTRNSKDTCLSIFKNYFVNKEMNYAYNLTEISKYYNLYENLMMHWKKLLPHFIFDIKYEKIIKNPEKQIRSLLKYCELNWDENCLKFYNNKRPIKTASDMQARQKIYNTSVNSWKKYQKYFN